VGSTLKKKGAGFQLLLKTAKMTPWLEREPGAEGERHHFSEKWAWSEFLRPWGWSAHCQLCGGVSEWAG